MWKFKSLLLIVQAPRMAKGSYGEDEVDADN
jgi:hypothetical protein